MQIDLELVLPGAPEPFRSQVCIVGGGIAGLVLATKLAGAGVDVHLLEGGGNAPEPEGRSQALYAAEMAASVHTGTTRGRFRTFGGSSTQWGGQLLPYPDDVFSPPVGVPSAGWPLWRSELSRFYPEVEELLGAGHEPYTAEVYRAFARELPEALTGSTALTLRASKWAPFSRRNLAQSLGEQTLASPHATVFFHANAVELLLADNGTRLAAVLTKDYRGNTFRFEAAQYVLAAGTIESSRLLLASRSVAAAGVGNGHDQVGRGFYDHLSYPAAVMTGAARRRLLGWFAPILDEGVTRTAKLEASPELRQRLGLLNVMAHLSIEEPEHSGAAVARALLRSVQQGELRAALTTSLPRLPGAAVDLVRLAYEARVKRRRFVSAGATVTLRVDCEQRARLENRVRLDSEYPDALGVPKAVVDWRVSADELGSIRAFAAFLREELPRIAPELGGIAWQPELMDADGEAALTGITDTYHPMGGCVMGTNAALSVVDPELRVHGVPNLSVASCATFPSGGSSNPTFTLMALTLRLAERLRNMAA